MKKLSGWHLLAPASVLVCAAALGPQFRFETTLSGAQEVPAVTTPTTAKLDLAVNQALSQASFLLKVANGQDVTAAHLHCGLPGENGPIVAFLYEGPTRDIWGTLAQGTLTNDSFEGNDCIPVIGRPVNNIASLAVAARDGLIYVNVHTEDNPGGEVRGQLFVKQEEGNNGNGNGNCNCDDDSDDDDSDDDDNGHGHGHGNGNHRH